MRSRTRDLSAALAGAILMTGCAAPPAASEPQGRVLAVDQVAGVWSLSAASGPSPCRLSLSNFVVEGRRPVLAENCSHAAASGARSWRPTAGGFELLSADGAVLMAFRRTGEDAFSGPDGLTLSRAAT